MLARKGGSFKTAQRQTAQHDSSTTLIEQCLSGADQLLRLLLIDCQTAEFRAFELEAGQSRVRSLALGMQLRRSDPRRGRKILVLAL